MSWGAVAVGVGTAVYGAVQGSEASRAAGGAARAQSAEAEAQQRRALAEANGSAERLRNLAAATPQELAAQQKGLEATGAHLEQQKRMLSAIDPAIMESSQQILKLLRGEQASSLGPLQQQRSQQRQQLLNTLRSQLGPGAETSAAGMKALRNFDMESNGMFQQAQSGQLNSLTGVLGSLNANTQGVSGAANANMSLASVFKDRQLQAESTAAGYTGNALARTSGAVIDNAGADFVGPMLQARNNQQLANSLGNLGMTAFGSMNKSGSGPGNGDSGDPGSFAGAFSDAGNAGAGGGNYRTGRPTARNAFE